MYWGVKVTEIIEHSKISLQTTIIWSSEGLKSCNLQFKLMILILLCQSLSSSSSGSSSSLATEMTETGLSLKSEAGLGVNR